MEQQIQGKSPFNGEIYKWTLTMPVGKWYQVSSVKTMPVNEFVDCITYLICCGEPLSFNGDRTAFNRTATTDLSYM